MPLSPVRRLLDFDAQYRRDQQHTPDFLHRRDRRLALARAQDGAPPPDAPAWLSALTAPGAGTALPPCRRARAALPPARAVLRVPAITRPPYVALPVPPHTPPHPSAAPLPPLPLSSPP